MRKGKKTCTLDKSNYIIASNISISHQLESRNSFIAKDIDTFEYRQIYQSDHFYNNIDSLMRT